MIDSSTDVTLISSEASLEEGEGVILKAEITNSMVLTGATKAVVIEKGVPEGYVKDSLMVATKLEQDILPLVDENDNKAISSSQKGLGMSRMAGRQYSNSWNYQRGSGSFYGRVEANVSVSDAPIFLKANGKAIASGFGNTYTVLDVGAGAGQVVNNKVLVTATVKSLNSTLVNFNRQFDCNSQNTGDILSPPNRSFFSISRTFWAGPIPITLSASAGGTLQVIYDYNLSCKDNQLTAAILTVTPKAWGTVNGGVSVSLFFIRGGASVTADILKTSIPATASIAPGQLCMNVQYAFQPISGHLDLWYQWRKFSWFSWGWGTRHSWTIWSFASSTYTGTAYNQCW